MDTLKRFYLFSLLLIAVLVPGIASAETDTLYSQAFGNKQNPVIVFLHDGPGRNAVSFEYTTAKALADRGFYVILFDQRGAGRSYETRGDFTFDEASNDIMKIMDKYEVPKASFLGHGFGGILGLEFAKRFPSRTEDVVLMNTILNYPAMYETILQSCRKYYTGKKADAVHYMDFLASLDHTSYVFNEYCMQHAAYCGLLRLRNPSQKSVELMNKITFSPYPELHKAISPVPATRFYDNEKYVTSNYTSLVKEAKRTFKVFGIYGTENGLFDTKSIKAVEKTIGSKDFYKVFNASHMPYIDQQGVFLDLVTNLIKRKK